MAKNTSFMTMQHDQSQSIMHITHHRYLHYINQDVSSPAVLTRSQPPPWPKSVLIATLRQSKQ